jgi:acetyl-CoA C-acetyltransferase
VAVLDINEKAAAEMAADIKGVAIACDVADATSGEAAVTKAAEVHGPARILVNCAGVGPATRIVGKDGPMPLADFERVIRIKDSVAADTHVRTSTFEQLAKIRPAFGGVQTGGNSSAIVDGAAAILVGNKDYATKLGTAPLARIVASAAVGVPPEIMGIGPVPAIKAVCERAGVRLDQVGRIEINEAFGAQVMACARALDLDEDKLNVNGGAIAIGHPLGATGIRLTLTLARELKRANLRYGISSACIGGGQGIAMLIENPDAKA